MSKSDSTPNTKERILMQAARLFHEKGYAATSMREIASAVGIEASSLYNHIDSKQELLEEICHGVSLAFQENILRMSVDQNLPLDKLKFLFAFHIQLAESDFTAVTAFNDEWRHLSDEAKQKFVEERRAYENYIERLIIKGQDLGQINDKLNPSMVTKTMLSSLKWMYFTKLGQRGWNSEDLLEDWCQLIFHGIVD